MRRRRTASVLIYCTVLLTAMLAISSLAVDLGRVQVAKTEMRRAADAAARAAASGMRTSLASVQSLAQTYAQNNLIDGSAIAFSTTNDVAVGTWNSSTKAFTASTFASANAVRVTLRRTVANGNPMPLAFARVLGRSTFDITVSSVVTESTASVAPGVCGLNSITIHKGMFAASYNSSVTQSPTHVNYNSHGVLASNGSIGTPSGGASNLYGTAVLGPAGSINAGVAIHGSTSRLSAAIPTPADVAYTPVANPGAVPTTGTFGSGTFYLPGGTYYFDSFTGTDNTIVIFTGAATVYLDGNFTANDGFTVTPYQSIPSNLVIHMSAGHTFTVRNSATLVCEFLAPYADFVATDSLIVEGSMVFKTITTHDNANIYFDEQLGLATGAPSSGVGLVH